MKFRDAAKAPKMGRTFNGMPTFQSSGNALVDLFSAIGSSRGKDLRSQFLAAYAVDRIKALKILLWARDVRGGAGERQTVRNLLVALEEKNPDDAELLVPLIPIFGRWDDLLVFRTERLRKCAYSVIADGLTDPSTSGLVAKWMPRKGRVALELEAFLGLRPKAARFNYTKGKAYPGKAYRRMLSTLSNVVEQQMCAKQWDEINFEHVPSLAAARYQKAFNRHCSARYQAYKASLVRGTAKINAAAVYPYDIIKSIDSGDRAVAKAQWEALPNYMGDEQIMAMVDVSGSMTARASGNLTNLQVACSLGLYIADKAKGPFKDTFLTFSGSPQIEVLEGDILQKYDQMKRAHWTMNTNLMGAFMEILKVGQRNGVADEDMPKTLMILSDMEFDTHYIGGKDVRAMDAARDMYAKAGYTLPKIVFWNLAARSGNSPVQYRENGTALVSGFSPAIMKSILKAQEVKAESFTPEAVMEMTIGQPRYDVLGEVSVPVDVKWENPAAEDWQTALKVYKAKAQTA